MNNTSIRDNHKNGAVGQFLIDNVKQDYRQYYFFVETKTKEQTLEDARRKRNKEIAFSITGHKK